MALPKLNTSRHLTTIPSTGQEVEYRPYLVKEEKILLMAMEEGEAASMAKAMKDIIYACTDGGVKTKNLAPFDIEYFFLQLRGKSVGDVIDLTLSKPGNVVCEEEEGENCQQICEMKLDVGDIKVDSSGVVDGKIELTDTIGVKMNYPQIETAAKYAGTIGVDMKTDNIFKMINECIEYVWDGEEIFKAKDSSKKELTEFIESLDTKQFTKIRDFFEGMPRLKHIVEWKCPKCDKTGDMLLEGIDSFFG